MLLQCPFQPTNPHKYHRPTHTHTHTHTRRYCSIFSLGMTLITCFQEAHSSLSYKGGREEGGCYRKYLEALSTWSLWGETVSNGRLIAGYLRGFVLLFNWHLNTYLTANLVEFGKINPLDVQPAYTQSILHPVSMMCTYCKHTSNIKFTHRKFKL